MWQPMSANLLKVYTGIPGYTSLPAAPNPGYSRYYYNNPDNLVKNQDLLRVDYAINSKMNTFFRWVNDYQKEQIQTGIWTGEPFPIQPQLRPKPGSSWSWNLVTTFTPTLASETILAYNHQSQSLSIVGTNPLDRTALGANWTQLYPQTNITNSVQDVSTGLRFRLLSGQPGMAQHRQGLCSYRKHVVGQRTAQHQVRDVLQPRLQDADRQLGAGRQHQLQLQFVDAQRHRQWDSQHDAGQFQQLQPEPAGTFIRGSDSGNWTFMPRTVGR